MNAIALGYYGEDYEDDIDVGDEEIEADASQSPVIRQGMMIKGRRRLPFNQAPLHVRQRIMRRRRARMQQSGDYQGLEMVTDHLDSLSTPMLLAGSAALYGASGVKGVKRNTKKALRIASAVTALYPLLALIKMQGVNDAETSGFGAFGAGGRTRSSSSGRTRTTSAYVAAADAATNGAYSANRLAQGEAMVASYQPGGANYTGRDGGGRRRRRQDESGGGQKDDPRTILAKVKRVLREEQRPGRAVTKVGRIVKRGGYAGLALDMGDIFHGADVGYSDPSSYGGYGDMFGAPVLSPTGGSIVNMKRQLKKLQAKRRRVTSAARKGTLDLRIKRIKRKIFHAEKRVARRATKRVEKGKTLRSRHKRVLSTAQKKRILKKTAVSRVKAKTPTRARFDPSDSALPEEYDSGVELMESGAADTDMFDDGGEFDDGSGDGFEVGVGGGGVSPMMIAGGAAAVGLVAFFASRMGKKGKSASTTSSKKSKKSKQGSRKA